MIHGHGGNIYELARRIGCNPSDIVDMSSNMNPLGPPPGLTAFLQASLDRITALPEVDAVGIRTAFCEKYGVQTDRVIAGNGTTQFIYSIPLAFGSRHALILAPAYADYADACRMHGVGLSFLTTGPETGFSCSADQILSAVDNTGADLVFICNPNNPTGVFMSVEIIKTVCAARPDVVFVIDESYLPFVEGDTPKGVMHETQFDNIVVLHSMSKIFGIPGLRIGFAVASEHLIQRLEAYNLPWCTNSLAQAAVNWLMTDKTVDRFVEETLTLLNAEKTFLKGQLTGSDRLTLFDSTTSFVLVQLNGDYSAETVCGQLGDRRILIRNCGNFQSLSDRFIRISLKLREQNRLLVGAIKEIL
ncbi:MAG: aminotransferase class I/II-fold pyridoxal phosphate-dependent enzyme [Thermodesulfobacteriota bacterium]|nr:aminotransferase class I/II-fold pyridoxal phosphate-dependent enzyme [Thermodesulfobacteriota bacterium]